jgi:hypothetical protein
MVGHPRSTTVWTWLRLACLVSGISAAMVLLCGSFGAPRASADEGPRASIVYNDTYVRLVAEFPSGWAPNACEIVVFLGGGGVCTAEFEPAYFYPDGTWGTRPWFTDSLSPRGWSVEPDPCTGLADHDFAVWASYVDFVNGYLDAGPTLTQDVIDRYAACWGWWF